MPAYILLVLIAVLASLSGAMVVGVGLLAAAYGLAWRAEIANAVRPEATVVPEEA